MSAPNEHLERELLALTDAKSVPGALVTLGLLPSTETPYHFDSVSEWARGGAETYVLYFSLCIGDQPPRGLLFKACAPFAMRPISEIFVEWLRRREILSRAGVSTPKLYGSGPAVLLEEYIPLTFTEALQNEELRPTLMERYGAYAAGLVVLGFKPISVHDLRSRGADVVAIDFGEDLGGERNHLWRPQEDGPKMLFVRLLEDLGVLVTPEDKDALYTGFSNFMAAHT
ncbi:MAG: hypothetical protein HY455_02995 [Parcubacteria group bacterium]|nr:hypothetical protein [Parcubacteria group bacterium]